MKPVVPKPQRCAIYTRKSTEHNLDLAFNSLDAQREACEAYIKSQAHEGWRLDRAALSSSRGTAHGCCSHEVTRPFTRLSYVVGLPSFASAFSNSCLTPRGRRGRAPRIPAARVDCARARGEERDDPAEEGDDAVGELAKGLRRMLEIQCMVLEIYRRARRPALLRPCIHPIAPG
jgi:hypothetical protein